MVEEEAVVTAAVDEEGVKKVAVLVIVNVIGLGGGVSFCLHRCSLVVRYMPCKTCVREITLSETTYAAGYIVKFTIAIYADREHVAKASRTIP